MTPLSKIFVTSIVLLAHDVTTTRLSIVLLCDYNWLTICEDALSESKLEVIQVDDVYIEVTGFVLASSGDFIQDLRTLHNAGMTFLSRKKTIFLLFILFNLILFFFI